MPTPEVLARRILAAACGARVTKIRLDDAKRAIAGQSTEEKFEPVEFVAAEMEGIRSTPKILLCPGIGGLSEASEHPTPVNQQPSTLPSQLH
ncbi:hypothetical protein FS837_010677 [Tulasnella sp. UAMH 9824]|nr:hypothetical protein FS837_010677 [Tulasnella sp. UAMH 9824]